MRLVLTSERYGIQELDINPMESSSILYQKLQYNTNNPTQYVTDHSLNITLPMTSNNMKVLNYYALLDSTQHMAEIPVLVMDGDNYICPGTLYINNIGLDHIDSTLQSDLHTYFNKMLNTTFWYDWMRGATPVNDMGMEVLSNMLDTNYNINKDTIYESWNTVPNPRGWQNQQVLNPLRATNYNPHTSQSHSIIAWAPCSSTFPNDFIKDQVVIGGYNRQGSDYIPSICNEISSLSSTNVAIFDKRMDPHYMEITEDNKAIVDEKLKAGLYPRQWNQYRSYHQKPTVYVNQIWRKYKEISNRYTGYNLVLDEEWFNENNTRYTDLVYTLPDIQSINQDEDSIGLNYRIDPLDMQAGCYGANHWWLKDVVFFGEYSSEGRVVTRGRRNAYLDLDLSLDFSFVKNPDSTGLGDFRMTKGSYIDVYVQVIKNDVPLDAIVYRYRISNGGKSPISYRKGIDFGWVSWQDPETGEYRNTANKIIKLTDKILIANNTANTDAGWGYSVKLTVLTNNGRETVDGYEVGNLFVAPDTTEPDITPIKYQAGDPTLNIYGPIYLQHQRFNRSFRQMEMKDFFPKNYCPFNILMQYCKLFNLVWVVDNVTNTVTVCTREKAFKEGKVYNWDNLVDRTKNIIFDPFSWDSQYITFNYKDADIDKLKEYKGQFMANYGDLKIKTSYNRNTSNKNLLANNDMDTIYPSIISSRSYYTMADIYNQTPEKEYLETFIDNRKKGETANAWGQFYFRNNNATWDTTDRKNYTWVDVEYEGGPTVTPEFRDLGICITDDTPFQMMNNLFMLDMTVYGSNSQYMRPLIENSTSSDTRPIFSVYDRNGEYNCWVGKPAAVYYYDRESVPEAYHMYGDVLKPCLKMSNDIYTTRWKRIIEEQYDKNNKLVTMYVHLTPIEYINLTCFDFVTFEHILYSIFKVEGYNEKEQIAKVQLLQVTDYDAYTRNDEVQ